MFEAYQSINQSITIPYDVGVVLRVALAPRDGTEEDELEAVATAVKLPLCFSARTRS
jgi:hypothetical protein